MEDTDTLADSRFRMYDPARRRQIDYGNLGNLGTPARPLLFKPLLRLGFDSGIHGFDLYRIQPEELRFYTGTRAFSEAYFSRGASQDDGLLDVRYARKFSKDLVFSLDYRTINNLGQYRHQRAKHNALAAGLWVPMRKGYDVFVVYSKNVMRQRDNGGITTDTLFGGGSFSGPIAAPVRLPEEVANTRLSDQQLQVHQYVDFKRAARIFRGTHTLSINQNTWKFTDAPLRSDSLFYGGFLVDRRGLRQYTHYKRLQNTLSIATFRNKKGGQSTDLMELGVTQSYFWMFQEPVDTGFSNLFLEGKITFAPSSTYKGWADFRLGLPGNFGEYRMESGIQARIGRAGFLTAGILSQRYPPDWASLRLFVSSRLVWENQLKKPAELHLWTTWKSKNGRLTLSGNVYHIQHYIYSDNNRLIAQSAEALQVFQAIGTWSFQWRALRMDHILAFQQTNLKLIFPYPSWFSKNSFYFDGRIFRRKLAFSAGIDLRVNASFQPEGYMPLSGKFHLQSEQTQLAYPWVDAFLSLKIQTFRFFLRAENLTSLFNNFQVYYQTAWHPQPFQSLRLGIGWRFRD